MKDSSLRQAILGVALLTGVLLLVPLIAMQFTREVSWGLVDFLAAGGLIFAAGTAIVVARRRIARPGARAAVIAAVALAFALVWAELAVGLFH